MQNDIPKSLILLLLVSELTLSSDYFSEVYFSFYHHCICTASAISQVSKKDIVRNAILLGKENLHIILLAWKLLLNSDYFPILLYFMKNQFLTPGLPLKGRNFFCSGLNIDSYISIKLSFLITIIVSVSNFIE